MPSSTSRFLPFDLTWLRPPAVLGPVALLFACATGCGSSDAGGNPNTPGGSSGGGGNVGGGNVDVDNPLTDPESGPPAGNPDGDSDIPAAAGLEDVSTPTTVVGIGTPESCTADAFIDAVAGGGVITFDCGPDPVTLTLDRPAKVFNDAADEVVIDGGGLVTLSGGGATRILYMNTCDEEQNWTTSHCDNQDHPRLTVQNITFVDGNSKSEPREDELDGGGAIWARGGRFKAVNTRFFNNVCHDDGADTGGGGIRVFDQHESQPVYIVNSTFGGAAELGNVCSNGGAISSIGVSWTIINSVFSYNRAIGEGANPPQEGTVGGGSGGAIYNDGNTITLSLSGSLIEHNSVNAHGAAVFFISNNHMGTLRIEKSILRNNEGGSWYALPGISMHDSTAQFIDDESILE